MVALYAPSSEMMPNSVKNTEGQKQFGCFSHLNKSSALLGPRWLPLYTHFEPGLILISHNLWAEMTDVDMKLITHRIFSQSPYNIPLLTPLLCVLLKYLNDY